MMETSVTLFERLQQPDNAVAWSRFVELYTPLLLAWARQRGLQDTDAADLVQDVLLVVYQRLPGFQYDPTRSFRGWLRTIAVNKANEFYRRTAKGQASNRDDLAWVASAEPDAFWDHQYRHHLFARALQIMQTEFEPSTWQAALQSVVSGRSAREVGQELGMSDAAVYQARCRVLRRLREELGSLWE